MNELVIDYITSIDIKRDSDFNNVLYSVLLWGVGVGVLCCHSD